MISQRHAPFSVDGPSYPVRLFWTLWIHWRFRYFPQNRSFPTSPVTSSPSVILFCRAGQGCFTRRFGKSRRKRNVGCTAGTCAHCLPAVRASHEVSWVSKSRDNLARIYGVTKTRDHLFSVILRPESGRFETPSSRAREKGRQTQALRDCPLETPTMKMGALVTSSTPLSTCLVNKLVDIMAHCARNQLRKHLRTKTPLQQSFASPLCVLQ